MGLRKVFYCVFGLDAFADAFDPVVVRGGIGGGIKLAEGHVEDVGGLVLVKDANRLAVDHILGDLNAIKARKVAPPLRIGDDLVWQAVEHNLQHISSTVVHRRTAGGRFKGLAIFFKEANGLT